MQKEHQDAVASTIATPGWAIIEHVLISEIVQTKRPAYLKTDGKTAEQIAIEVKAAELACNAVRNAINKVKRAGSGTTIKKQKFV